MNLHESSSYNIHQEERQPPSYHNPFVPNQALELPRLAYKLAHINTTAETQEGLFETEILGAPADK